MSDETETAQPGPEEIDLGKSASDVIAAEAPAADLEGKTWDKALVLAGGGKIPAGEKRPVVVVEVRTDDGVLADVDYPANGDLYFRMSEEVKFGKVKAPVLTLGDNVLQGLFWGLSPDVRWVHTGPSHPAYAGVNAAYSRGARDIEVVGLSDYWKERLKVFIDRIPTDKQTPATDVKIVLK